MELLQQLCGLFGPSGCEGEVRRFIRAQAQPYADEIRQDSLGNLMIFRRGRKTAAQSCMLCAHMDEVGFIAKEFTEDGMVRFGLVGGVDPRVVIGRRVKLGPERITGLVGIKAVHLTTAEERKHMPAERDLYLDIGAKSKEEAQGMLQYGDYGVFDSDSVCFGDGLFKARAIDDRLGCAVLLTLLKDQPEYDTWFVFTVQEEVGLRGARCAAYQLKPDICLVVESTTAADLPDADAHQQVCRVRGGAVIPFMDRATIYDEGLFTLLRSLAQEHGIPWQTKHRIAGGTDAGRIHLTHGGVRTAALAAPVRYIHSPSCVAAQSDMLAVLELARRFLEKMGEVHHV